MDSKNNSIEDVFKKEYKKMLKMNAEREASIGQPQPDAYDEQLLESFYEDLR